MRRKKLAAWKILQSKLIINNRWVKIRQDTIRLPDGSVIDDYFVRETSGVVVVFALTADQKVITIKQYRHGVRRIVQDLPSGIVEPKETPLRAVKRELLEETGYRANTLRKVGQAYAEPTGSDTLVHYYLATGCTKIAQPLDDPREQIMVETLTVPELKRRAGGSGIACQFCLSAILLSLSTLKKT
ncbi:NUDIX hydrolase [Candidatus Berkelbacteria bacterium]|nr:NUDIX hydrolase [Candidatus Berkelbacteria bacterium]